MSKSLSLLLIFFNTIVLGSTLKDAILSYEQKKFKEAKKLFENAIKEENSVQANYFLGKIYLFGEGTKKDPEKALRYFQKAEKSGNIKAKCLKIKTLLQMGKEISKEEENFLNSPLAKNLKECKNIKTTNKDKK